MLAVSFRSVGVRAVRDDSFVRPIFPPVGSARDHEGCRRLLAAAGSRLHADRSDPLPFLARRYSLSGREAQQWHVRFHGPR